MLYLYRLTPKAYHEVPLPQRAHEGPQLIAFFKPLIASLAGVGRLDRLAGSARGFGLIASLVYGEWPKKIGSIGSIRLSGVLLGFIDRFDCLKEGKRKGFT